MTPLPDRLPEEEDIFRLFRILRESTARVSHAFVRRVSTRLASLVDEERLQSPSILELAGRLSLDSLNIVSSAALSGQTDDARKKGDPDGSDEDR